MRMLRVSSFLPEMTQQIHSLRASGVMSFHTTSDLGLAASAARKSGGSVCTVLVVATVVISSILSPTSCTKS